MGYTPPQLEVRKISGGWSMFPPDYTTTDDLTIYPNGVDTTAKIVLLGAGQAWMVAKTSVLLGMNESSTLALLFSYTTPDFIITPQTTDKNIFLNPQGTGVVKFGTYTAGAATDSTGYITILDASGNTRKLMVQA